MWPVINSSPAGTTRPTRVADIVLPRPVPAVLLVGCAHPPSAADEVERARADNSGRHFAVVAQQEERARGSSPRGGTGLDGFGPFKTAPQNVYQRARASADGTCAPSGWEARTIFRPSSAAAGITTIGAFVLHAPAPRAGATTRRNP